MRTFFFGYLQTDQSIIFRIELVSYDVNKCIDQIGADSAPLENKVVILENDQLYWIIGLLQGWKRIIFGWFGL